MWIEISKLMTQVVDEKANEWSVRVRIGHVGFTVMTFS
jgi:hypothetical protein